MCYLHIMTQSVHINPCLLALLYSVTVTMAFNLSLAFYL